MNATIGNAIIFFSWSRLMHDVETTLADVYHRLCQSEKVEKLRSLLLCAYYGIAPLHLFYNKDGSGKETKQLCEPLQMTEIQLRLESVLSSSADLALSEWMEFEQSSQYQDISIPARVASFVETFDSVDAMVKAVIQGGSTSFDVHAIHVIKPTGVFRTDLLDVARAMATYPDTIDKHIDFVSSRLPSFFTVFMTAFAFAHLLTFFYLSYKVASWTLRGILHLPHLIHSIIKRISRSPVVSTSSLDVASPSEVVKFVKNAAQQSGTITLPQRIANSVSRIMKKIHRNDHHSKVSRVV